MLPGEKVMCTWVEEYKDAYRYERPKLDRVYTIQSNIDLPQGPGLTLVEFPKILTVRMVTQDGRIEKMQIPFKKSRFRLWKTLNN